MAKVSRKDLIQYFRKGNKPTESQFEDLIDSNLNLLDSEITIDVNRNVGLGIDNPTGKLHVDGKSTCRWCPAARRKQ